MNKNDKNEYDPYAHLSEDDRRAMEYYDRKVKRAEEVFPYIGLAFVLGMLFSLIFWWFVSP